MRDTRSSILGRVKDLKDQDAWSTFFSIYSPLIRRQAIQSGLSEDEAQEVTQETLVEISRRMQDFEYDRQRGSFKAWLWNLTHWRIANQFAKRRRGMISIESLAENDSSSEHLESVPALATAPNESWEKQWREVLCETALNNLRQELPPKHLQVFHLLTVKEWNVSTVAAFLNMNRTHVRVVKFRVTSALRDEIQRLEKAGM